MLQGTMQLLQMATASITPSASASPNSTEADHDLNLGDYSLIITTTLISLGALICYCCKAISDDIKPYSSSNRGHATPLLNQLSQADNHTAVTVAPEPHDSLHIPD